MKGSKRDHYAIGTRLDYRNSKLYVSDELRIDVIYGKESPYGVFQDYMLINPYYRKGSGDNTLHLLWERELLVNKYPRIMKPLYPVFQNRELQGL